MFIELGFPVEVLQLFLGSKVSNTIQQHQQASKQADKTSFCGHTLAQLGQLKRTV